MRTLLRKFRTASKFSWREWRTLAVASYFLFKIRLLLLFFPIQMVEKAIQSGIASVAALPRNDEPLAERVKSLRRLFRIACRYQGPKPRCLATSLAEHAFLSHYRFPAFVSIGVKKENGSLQAHSWCEGGNLDFQPLERLNS